ncbi:AbiTii domain-containing protein [Martelella soudanensis]|uniref:AbiTii domain-containing protein n=1 Tax=unclassified Martelella TaxID=2629616 RepID=UPI0015DE9F89|nr:MULTISPECIES: hypothetical protein [unclassified Martelella]
MSSLKVCLKTGFVEMSLLREIQQSLMQENSEIGPVLLKLRFLASKLGSDLLEEWVKHEGEGYPKDVEVPEYRKLTVTYKATFSGAFGSGITNAPIPPFLIEKYCGDGWNEYSIRQSVAAVDSLLSGGEGGVLQINASDLILLLQGKIYENMACNSVTGILSKAGLVELQYAVRSKILEFTIELEKKIPAAAEVKIGAAEQLNVQDTEKVTQLTHQIFLGDVTTIHSSGGENNRVNLNSNDSSANASE